MPELNDDSPEDIPAEELKKNLESSKFPQTDKVNNSILPQLFVVPENKQYTYATFTESFEKYKVRIDLFKWLIGTVGLTLITYIINWGFKDREQGLIELQVYDKYVSENVVFAENPKNRLQLAQFFAYVTPSEKLKCGWSDYLEVVKVEVDSFKNKLERSRIEVLKLEKESNQSPQAENEYLEAKKKYDELQRINNIKLVDEKVPVISFRKTSVENQSEDSAKKYELRGFESLLSKNLDNAVFNFKMSENSLNGYHEVYGIAMYLEGLKENFSNDNQTWRNIYNYILENHNWKMPVDIKQRLISASK